VPAHASFCPRYGDNDDEFGGSLVEEIHRPDEGWATTRLLTLDCRIEVQIPYFCQRWVQRCSFFGESIRQGSLPEVSLLKFFLPGLFVALQSGKISMGITQDLSRR
jgi:hypothetical protein